MIKEFLEFLIASIIGLFGWFFGGIDGFFLVLIASSFVDYVSGVCAAGVKHEISSATGFLGIARKLFMFSLVGIAHLIDKYLLGNTETLRAAVCLFYIGNEGISILENAIKLKIPIPDFLREKFLTMKDHKN